MCDEIDALREQRDTYAALANRYYEALDKIANFGQGWESSEAIARTALRSSEES